jgi:hypothetical protein
MNGNHNQIILTILRISQIILAQTTSPVGVIHYMAKGV